MDCILKITSGPEAGQEFLCSSGTYLGRSQRCLVRLTSPDISFEHALITRMGDDFFVENLSANGTLLNGQRLAIKTRLRVKDQIQLGGTTARVEGLPAAQSGGGNRRVLLLVLLGMMVAAACVVVLFSDAPPTTQSQATVYRQFLNFTQNMVYHQNMSPDVPRRLMDAWRLENSGDRLEAAKAWVKVRVLLDAWDHERARIENRPPDDLRNYRNLHDLQSGKVTSLSDEDMRIALKQWVIQMEQAK